MPEMSSSKYNLKWQDYRDTVSSSFGSLRTDTELCDIRLVSEDEEQVLAHKVVLSTCSKFFKTLLCKLSGPNAVAYLGGVNTRHLHYVLDYIYLGEVNIAHEDVDSFLEQAKKFKLQGFETHKGSENIQREGLIKPKEEALENVVDVDGATEILEAGCAAEDLRKPFAEPRSREADDTFLLDRSLPLCNQLFTKFTRRLKYLSIY